MMTCWDLLGIEPTTDRRRIEEAYQSQLKFASGETLKELKAAYREALGEEPGTRSSEKESLEREQDKSAKGESGRIELDAGEEQVRREVLVQIRAMLNDSSRRGDAAVWRAILTEPPADREAIRETLSDDLYPLLKQDIENGELPTPVLNFLAEWFGWDDLVADDAMSVDDPMEGQHDPNVLQRGSGDRPDEQPDSHGMNSFWPSIIGWLIALVVLTTFFSQFTGS